MQVEGLTQIFENNLECVPGPYKKHQTLPDAVFDLVGVASENRFAFWYRLYKMVPLMLMCWSATKWQT